MAQISFGGGPTLQARMEFSNLKEGTQVPGYRGYVPQIKYAIGKTYGADTCELSQSHGLRRSVHTVGATPRPPIYNKLPAATGDNKYTEQMVPGYTGYIPRRPFNFGDTYKRDCEYCIDQHITNSKRHAQYNKELVQATKSLPRLKAINQDPAVRDHLNTYMDCSQPRPILNAEKRAPTEAPMPGYQGYVPRITTTELGLGSRFKTNTELGFRAFYNETAQSAQRNGEPISIERCPTEPAMDVTGQISPINKRLYVQSGMVPKYTGYVPQRRYQFGDTYGNTTRSLDVCSHGQENFGNFIKSNPKPTASFAC